MQNKTLHHLNEGETLKKDLVEEIEKDIIIKSFKEN